MFVRLDFICSLPTMTSAPFANIAQQPMMALDKESKEDIEAWARIVNTQLGKKLKESNLPLKGLVAKSLEKGTYRKICDFR